MEYTSRVGGVYVCVCVCALIFTKVSFIILRYLLTAHMGWGELIDKNTHQLANQQGRIQDM